ncbi:uncharacterized protein MONOS_8273 [Monocercomonoides exilis]|uniref:uncharacterized protein n=1 Tax=Monocercomonoides exilis TaxID=2049356 RepID=UPI003559B0E8|nr:hypothetical protein MONOS_8273 [Monocercomonoides exilis]|eukprot:MONOS_8273.1-p1 / transcript=MONOS_8273.1 / gene=MONOS_8273 / organism=Monocercomonoides_exilis_PA203 / gene_product=unspecified product / transcript_product=unspecified product / location=Mono_scaffold00308:9673-11091(+) / protein_length=472 / sequence_SO=supercontig / SO=protein_coding / is_pseudo=false
MYSNIFNCLNTTFKTIATKRDPNNSNERYSYRITVSSNKSFSNCEWVSCTSSYSGGALFISSSYSYAVGNVQVNKCSFSECTSHQNGGAIASGTSSYSYYYYPLSISDSSFKNCSGSFGGALYNIATMYVLTSEGSSCSASSMGGFAFISKGLSIVVQFANCQINKCSANTGGGIVVVNCGPLLNISSCTFSQCESKIGGGAIVVSMYSLSTEIFEMTSCSFRENKVKNKTYHFGNDIYIVNYEKSVPSDFLSTSTSTSETPRLYIDGYGPCDEYWKKLVEKKKFPVVAIVLIIVGVVIFVVVIVIIICCCCRKKKKSDSSASNVATTGIVVDTIVEQQQYVPTQAINPSCQGYGVQQQQMQFSGMQPGLMNGYSSYGPAPSQMQPSGQYPVSVAPMMNSPQGSIQQAQPMQPMQPVQPMQQMQPMQPIQPAQQQVAFTIPQQCMTNQPPMEQTQAYELTDVNEKANDFVVA